MSTGIEPLTAERYVQSVAADVVVIGRACREYPDRAVPTCPEWTGADLLAHLAAFTAWLTAVFDGSAGVASVLPVVDPAAALRDWDATGDDLAGLLRGVDPHRAVPNWSTGEQTAAFWLRRTAQDVAIHRVDAAGLVTDAPEPVPADIAHDGVGEYLDVFVTAGLAAGAPATKVTLELEMTDAGTVRRDLPDPGPVTTLRGTASDLLLGLWHRRDPLGLVVAGDPAPIEKWPHI
ncbi:maleylpyruvate isomerase N-terminal domain-containing protein [Pseudonocardia endophytica]|uniref:Uncharacterized protein (TIGR03083 family) n=1 Tax=Pseudonocardia endophytica TaxID=401976 RepID=A0A4R1HUZ7_PSEEN|nr:maleylpyruvate isomerase family mycothiol-dependent enzyme [Pseudonocardia endophytica]TCK26554.1 uncharacterized protein (TIGR03083 family) [Pseudonocardia endophytica]